MKQEYIDFFDNIGKNPKLKIFKQSDSDDLVSLILEYKKSKNKKTKIYKHINNQLELIDKTSIKKIKDITGFFGFYENKTLEEFNEICNKKKI